MAGNSLGTVFKITTFGESHGPALGVIIDGCPAGLAIDTHYIIQELALRRPGQSAITTQRKEEDIPEILSGVYDGVSTGTPICIIIRNTDQRSKDYGHNTDVYRPSHADYTYQSKYGIRDHRGGGRSSARETAARVAAGAIAKTLLGHYGIEIFAWVKSVGTIKSEDLSSSDYHALRKERELNMVRNPNQATAKMMEDHIKEIKKAGDTVGGEISCIINNVPAGLGEPVFNKLHAALGMAMLGINAAHGFEYGSGFKGAEMRGTAHNDSFYTDNGAVKTRTNNSGGIQGGISNGMPITFNVAFKPIATILAQQDTINAAGDATVISGKGRHDPCVVPRAVVIVEAMAALVLADFLLMQRISRM